jgi:hypothetical protein
MKCRQCTKENTTEIEIQLKSEEKVRFFSCRFCEFKWWKYEGEPIALDRVLSLTAAQAPAR